MNPDFFLLLINILPAWNDGIILLLVTFKNAVTVQFCWFNYVVFNQLISFKLIRINWNLLFCKQSDPRSLCANDKP